MNYFHLNIFPLLNCRVVLVRLSSKKTTDKCHILPGLTCTQAVSQQAKRIHAVGDRTVPVIYSISSSKVFFSVQLTKLCHYTFIVQEVFLFPFLASFPVAFPCFTGCSKLNITFKLHNKDLGGREWIRKVMGREVSAKIRSSTQLCRM